MNRAHPQRPLAPFHPGDFDHYLAEIINGDPLTQAAHWASEHADALTRHALDNGIAPLAHFAAGRHPQNSAIPNDLVERLMVGAQASAAQYAIEQGATVAVLQALNEHRLPFLVLKGAAIAHSHYERPYLRARCDIDLLFSNKSDADQAGRLLEAQGFGTSQCVEGEHYNYEKAYFKPLGVGSPLTVDVHWQAFNNNIYGPRLSFGSLLQSSLPVPGFPQGTLGLNDADALLFGAIHRLTHAYEGKANRAIWLYDIHLLASALDDTGWSQLLDRARETGTAHACLDAILASAEIFPTPVPGQAYAALAQISSSEKVSHQFLRSNVGQAMSDIWALPTWGQRVRVARNHLFPGASYMRHKYQASANTPLAWLHLRRIAGAVGRRLRRQS